MCASPNVQHSELDSYVLFTNLTTFQQENDLKTLSETLDELFSGYLDSELCKADETAKVERFRDYLKLKELLGIIE